VASKHLKYEKTSALPAKSIMLHEEDLRAAMQHAYRQGPDGVKAGWVASKDSVRSHNRRESDPTMILSLPRLALARCRGLWVTGITAIGSGPGQDAASRTVALARPGANSRFLCASGGAFSPTSFLAGKLAPSYFTDSSNAWVPIFVLPTTLAIVQCAMRSSLRAFCLGDTTNVTIEDTDLFSYAHIQV